MSDSPVSPKTATAEPCPHPSMSGAEGSVAELGRMPELWRCDQCDALLREIRVGEYVVRFERASPAVVIRLRADVVAKSMCCEGTGECGIDYRCGQDHARYLALHEAADLVDQIQIAQPSPMKQDRSPSSAVPAVPPDTRVEMSARQIELSALVDELTDLADDEMQRNGASLALDRLCERRERYLAELIRTPAAVPDPPSAPEPPPLLTWQHETGERTTTQVGASWADSTTSQEEAR